MWNSEVFSPRVGQEICLIPWHKHSDLRVTRPESPWQLVWSLSDSHCGQSLLPCLTGSSLGHETFSGQWNFTVCLCYCWLLALHWSTMRKVSSGRQPLSLHPAPRTNTQGANQKPTWSLESRPATALQPGPELPSLDQPNLPMPSKRINEVVSQATLLWK